MRKPRKIASFVRRSVSVLACVAALCAFGSAQRVQFTAADRAEILERVKEAPASDAERASRIRAWFAAAGCNGKLLREQTVTGAVTPNMICELRGEGGSVQVEVDTL